MSNLIETVAHLKKKLDKGVGYDKTLHILHKLQKINITIELLESTGIGKTIRELSKKCAENDIGKTAKIICMSWKSTVKQQQQSEMDYDMNSQTNHSPKVSNKSKHRQKSDDSDDNEVQRQKKRKSKRRHHHNDDVSDDDANIEKTPEKSSKKHAKSSHREIKKEKNTHVEVSQDYCDKSTVNSHVESRKSKSSGEGSSVINDKNSGFHTKIKTDPKWEETILKVPKALANKDILKPLEKLDIMSALPVPNYKPLPNKERVDEKIEANKRKMQVAKDEDKRFGMHNKVRRTAVFAGHARSSIYTHVYKLEDLCIRVLMDNIDKITHVGDAPFYLLKPILEKCNPKQLMRIEKMNSHLIEDTDEIWEEICKKEFKNNEPNFDDDESWRQFYMRSVHEREEKIKSIAQKISLKEAKSTPVRQTQRAFTEANAKPKPPKEVIRQQERHASNGSSNVSTGGCVKLVAERSKVAPLMKKVLLMKKRRKF